MDRLMCMQVFLKVVEKGSFSAAAEAVGISPTMVGKHVMYLERRLGSRLLNRTTRRQSLTEVGGIYYERCKVALAEVEAAEASASAQASAPRGVLRVSAPVSFGASALVRALSDYLRQYPEVQVELSLNDRVVDLVEEGFDAVIRIGELPDSTLIARQLAPYRMVACAAPAYLQMRGIPATPSQLAQHNCMGFMYSSAQKRWQFGERDAAERGMSSSVPIAGNFRVNSGQALRTAALLGMGIIAQPEILVADDLASGALVRILPDYGLPAQSMHLLYSSNRQVSAKLKSFADFIVQRFGEAMR